MKKNALIAACLTLILVRANGVNIGTHCLETQSAVKKLVVAGDQVVIGGFFTLVNGEARHYLAKLDSSGNVDAGWAPALNAPVYAMVSDGTNIYAGGTFTEVKGTPCAYLAKISLANGATDAAWAALAPDSRVTALLLDGPNLYVGGTFTNIGGLPRSGLARLLPDGTADPAFSCAVQESKEVHALARAGSYLFVGGNFMTLGGQPRQRFARTALDGTVDAGFIRDANGEVYSLAVDESALFIGGRFSQLDGKTRHAVAKMTWSAGFMYAPFTNGPVFGSIYSMSVADDGLFLGGRLTQIAGQDKSAIAKVDKTSGIPVAAFTNDASPLPVFSPPDDPYVYAIEPAGQNLYVGGTFWRMGGELAPSIAKISAETGAHDSIFRARVNSPGSANALWRQADGKLLIGGDFHMADGHERHGLVRLLADGAVDEDWKPFTCLINAVASDSIGVFFGGTFFEVEGLFQSYLAKSDTSGGGIIETFRPFFNNPPLALWPEPGALYAGGEFTEGFVKLDPGTGAKDAAFTGVADAPVHSLLLEGGSLYAGGQFTQLGGQPRLGLAKADAATGAAAPDFVCNANGDVLDLATDGTNLFAGGRFTQIGGQARQRLARISLANGAIEPVFNNGFDADIEALALSGQSLFVGGWFTNACGQPRLGLAKLNAADSALDESFTNQPDGAVLCMLAQGHRLHVGGNFSAMSGNLSPGFVSIGFPPVAPLALPATDAGLRGFSANWAAADEAANYRLDVAADAAFADMVAGYSNRNAGDSLTHSVTGLCFGATYYYRLRAEHDGGPSSNSAVISVSTLIPSDPPSPPAGLSASDGAHTDRVAVTWNQVADASGYTLWRGASADPADAAQISAAAANSFDDTTAAAGTLYHYWVKATNHLGSSAFSEPDLGYRATVAGEPGLPTGVSASDGSHADCVRVSWTAGSGATGHEVYRARVDDSAAPIMIGTAAATTYSDTGARRNVRYAYWVRSTNSVGTSPHSVPDTGWRRGLPAGYSGGVKSDFAVFDSNTGCWYIISGDGTVRAWAFAWGWPGAWPVPGDYNGDGVSDLAVFDQNTGCWYIAALDGTVLAWAFAWGWPGARPVSGDYDGDAVSDLAVFDQNTGWWYVAALTSVQSSVSSIQTSKSPNTDNRKPTTASPRVIAWAFAWGWPGAWPVPGDYNGDGKSDCAVFDQNTGWWYVASLSSKFKVQGSKLEDESPDTDNRSPNTDSPNVIAWAFAWGWPGAWPVSGDYDGDGKADCAVFDQNTGWWYVAALTSVQSSVSSIQTSKSPNTDNRTPITGSTRVIAWAFAWGWPGAWPVSGDYNGDGISDCAVFDQNTGWWYAIELNGTEPLVWAFQWGWPGARPVGAF